MPPAAIFRCRFFRHDTLFPLTRHVDGVYDTLMSSRLILMLLPPGVITRGAMPPAARYATYDACY